MRKLVRNGLDDLLMIEKPFMDIQQFYGPLRDKIIVLDVVLFNDL